MLCLLARNLNKLRIKYQSYPNFTKIDAFKHKIGICQSPIDIIATISFKIGKCVFECNICITASKINITPKGVRLSEKLQHSIMKFDRSNKFDLCYYGQVNSLRLKSSAASKWANKHFLWGNIYSAVDGTFKNIKIKEILCQVFQHGENL